MGDEAIYAAIGELKRRGGRAVLATLIAVRGSSPAALGSKMLILEGRGEAIGTVGGGCVDGQVWTAAPNVLATGQPRSLEIDLTDRDGDPDHGLICGGLVTVFLEPIRTDTLIICGAGHIAQALTRLAVPLDFKVHVIDDRAAFANAQRFPQADLHIGPFETILSGLITDPNDALIVVTRGHRYDEACLRWALSRDLAYTGLIGSRTKISRLKARLARDGVDPARLRTLRAPVGLAIGAITVEEIALSIAAELVALKRLGPGISRELAPNPGAEQHSNLT